MRNERTNRPLSPGRPRRSRRSRRGVVLLGVMLVLLLLLAAALAGVLSSGFKSGGNAADQAQNSLGMTRARITSYGAQNMADAGVRAALQWLNDQGSAPDPLVAFRPSQYAAFWTGSTVSGNYDHVSVLKPDGTEEGAFDVRLYPYANNATATTKSYVIESIGTYQGKQQIVRAAVTQDSFAKYAFFADNAPVNTWWSSHTTIFNGPVHINGRNMDTSSPDYNPAAHINILWQNTGDPGDRIFRYNGEGAFTTAVTGDQITWARGNKDNTQAPSDASDWSSVAAYGQDGIRTGAPLVDMPTQSSRQSDAALGTPPATIPAGPSVTIPTLGSTTNGGIYINGDVDNLQFRVNDLNPTSQGIRVYQNDGTQQIRTSIWISPLANGGGGEVRVTTATAPLGSSTFTIVGTTQTYAGTTNGVIYVNGNIGTQTGTRTGGVFGVIADNVLDGDGNVVHANNLTLATEASKGVNINGSLTYHSVASQNPRVPGDSSAVFGIVTNKLEIIENDISGNPLGDVTVDATVFAYDTFDALNALTRNFGSPKTFTLTGGYIVKNSGTFAGIDANGTTWTGFVINRNYDSRVANRPPPYFPSTGNHYKIRSYQRVNALLQ